MIQVRIHGRGGQGSVTLAQLIATAAYTEGWWAQAFPMFGVERRGAPVEAYARIAEEKIHDRSQVTVPTHLLVQDPSLLDVVDVTEGLNPGGTVIVNAVNGRSIDVDGTVVPVDATGIARTHLERPVTNTALLGAMAAQTDLFGLDTVESVLRDAFDGEIADQNVTAATVAYEEVNAA